MAGRFIVLEGGEGSGKSTLARNLGNRFRANGTPVVLTREPGGTPAGELVRGLLHEDLVPWAETFAFLTARTQLVATVIRPALERGETVICDRFAASTFAYQGYARGLDREQLHAANAIATAGLVPDITLFIDLDPAVGLARKHGEAEAIRAGLEALAFHERVRAGYIAQAKVALPGSWETLDGSRSPEEVEAVAWAALLGELSPAPTNSHR